MNYIAAEDVLGNVQGQAVELSAIKARFGISGGALGKMAFPDIKWVVPGYVPEGCSILAGRPKLGKSWLVLDIAMAVARGGYCLGDVRCEKGDVLYLALEDNKRRLQSRVRKISPPRADNMWPDNIIFATEWPRCDVGGIALMREWLEAMPNPRLIIVDVLAQFRAGRDRNENPYESDYKAVKALQELAGEYSVAIIIVHHVRKGMGDVDPFERVSGTMGLTGAADSTIILDRDSNGCTLYARGRDLEEYERAVTFDKETCRWIAQGEAADVRRTDERSQILAALEDATEPMSPREVSIASAMARNNVDQLLFKMAKAGEVVKTGRGKYVHANRFDLINAQYTPDKKDKKIRSEEGEDDD
jgi:RecA-family ATPase